MAIGYRAILTTDPTKDNLQRIIGVFQEWVTHRKEFANLPIEGREVNSLGHSLQAEQYTDKHISANRWTLTEQWEAPKWYDNPDTSRTGVTTLTLAWGDQRLWLWTDVEPPTLEYQNSHGRYFKEPQMTSTPVFMRQILNSVHLYDGVAEPLSQFQLIATPSHVEHLKTVLRDEDRIGAVFVTSPPVGQDPNDWAARINNLAGRMHGMAFGYVLTQEIADLFNAEFEQTGHGVPHGAMRTYLPAVNLSDPQDSYRHRLLQSSTIDLSDNTRLERILRKAQAKRLDVLRVPNFLREVDYEFLRRVRRQPMEAMRSRQPSESISVEQIGEIIDLADSYFNDYLAIQDRNTALEEELAEAQLAIEETQAESDSYYAELGRVRQQLRNSVNEIAYLRRALQDLGAKGAEAAYSFSDYENPRSTPKTFAEFLDEIEQFSGVRFTGSREVTLELDEHTVLGAATVQKAWDAICTFNHYSQARQNGHFDGSLSQYLTDHSHGFPVQIGQIVWTEGKTVKSNERLRAQRELPVDERVDPSGKAFMGAHVKLSNCTGVAPRLYFLDTYLDVGYVTVGYVGTHMDNTMTN